MNFSIKDRSFFVKSERKLRLLNHSSFNLSPRMNQIFGDQLHHRHLAIFVAVGCDT